MARIKLLPESVANKIAAGEVVERPASVVKELIENSIDAGATEIWVEVRKGGVSLVRVRDNGCGMGREDALLALARHSTSKISEASDLFCIRTMGFRGEAIPSIAAVSRMELTTKEPGALSGTRISAEGGKVGDVRDVGAPDGTEVVVRDLFFNTPVRRKFLRSERAETSQIASTVISEALSMPRIGFTLIADGEELIKAPAVEKSLDRISSLLGPEIAKGLLICEGKRGAISLAGFISGPELTRGTRADQHFFVNGRAVQDKILSFAIADACSGILPAKRHPVAFVFLEIDPSEVDVNVHPAKREVRFRDASLVRDLVRSALSGALGGSGMFRESGVSPFADAVREPEDGYQTKGGGGVFERAPIAPPTVGYLPWEGSDVLLDEKADRFRPIGQIRNLYIICEDAEGMVVVDQHAAHERILFEKVMAIHEKGKGELQSLLLPVSVSLSAAEAALMDGYRETFRSLGLGVEAFGKNAVKVDHLPACLGDVNPERLVRDVLGELMEEGRGRAVRDGIAEIVARKVCHAAVKRRDSLNAEQMQKLIDDLLKCVTPYTCPHGRPTMFRMSKAELDKKFGRT
ncbi:MAG: DNA mismatch repair endonuclease MutL [Candidatus Aureabacteria bacterium]|nr:DNA mismatch repair endonuclease MutL [Candidatus Auribacterota bacterium]